MRSRFAASSSRSRRGVRSVGRGRTDEREPLTIYAAASLTEVFKAFDPAQRYSFAGSNALETQIRSGAPADIFASAAPLNTQRLFRAGVVDKPVTFTANRLVLIVPKSNPAGAAFGLRPEAQARQARRSQAQRFRSAGTRAPCCARWA